MNSPPPTRQQIHALQHAWAQPINDRAKPRLVVPNNLHLTMKFLGSVSDSTLSSVKRALEALISTWSAPSQLTFGEFGSFPFRHQPRSIYLSIDTGNEQLVEGMQQIDTSFAKLGFKPEQRRKIPHITLARWPPDTIAPNLAETSNIKLPLPFSPEALCLYRSESTPEGPLYTVLKRYPLLKDTA